MVPRTLASCAALLVLGVFQGGLSLAVAPLFWLAANCCCCCAAGGGDAQTDWLLSWA